MFLSLNSSKPHFHLKTIDTKHWLWTFPFLSPSRFKARTFKNYYEGSKLWGPYHKFRFSSLNRSVSTNWSEKSLRKIKMDRGRKLKEKSISVIFSSNVHFREENNSSLFFTIKSLVGLISDLMLSRPIF